MARRISVMLDMDGVIVDFLAGFCAAAGMNVDDIPRGFWWDIPRCKSGICSRQMWEDLPIMPWGKAVIDAVEQVFGEENVALCTTPLMFGDDYTPGCMDGKLGWIAKHLPSRYSGRFVFTAHKHLLAAPGVVLIDDKPQNVSEFQESGGHSYLFPAHTNGRFREVPSFSVARFTMELLKLRDEAVASLCPPPPPTIRLPGMVPGVVHG
jgi:5'(3')-deoxyribonucleotidase